jgi:hypothetical protein
MLEQSQASNCSETAQKRFLFRSPDDNVLSLVSPTPNYTVVTVTFPRTSTQVVRTVRGGQKLARYFLIVDLRPLLCIIGADPEQGRTMHQIARPQLQVLIELELVGVFPEKIHAGLAPFSQVPAKATHVQFLVS